MSNKNKSLKYEITNSVIIGILAIIGSVVVTFFAPGSFLIHPVFEIEANQFTAENLDIITIKNTGWVQAKNVEVDIISLFTNSTIVSYYCPERNLIFLQKTKQHTMQLH